MRRTDSANDTDGIETDKTARARIAITMPHEDETTFLIPLAVAIPEINHRPLPIPIRIFVRRSAPERLPLPPPDVESILRCQER